MPMQPDPRPAHEPPDFVIEGLRGLAALMVVAAHYLPHFFGIGSFGYTGVDLFFVLSGFVFAPYLAGRPLPLLPHLLRRWFRLYPLYLVALALYAVLHLVRGEPLLYLPQHLALLHTWQNTVVASYYNAAFWSLPPEVEFYLLLPLLARWVRSLGGLLWLGAAALLLRLAVMALQPFPAVGEGLPLALSVHLPGVLVEFVAGALAWRATRLAPGVGRRLTLLLLGLALWLLAAGLFVRSLGTGQVVWLAGWRLPPGSLDLLAAAAYAAGVAGLAGAWARPPGWLVAACGWLGALSYGVYLFHNAMLQIVPPALPGTGPLGWALASLFATLLVAAVLHRALEAPARAWGRQLARRATPGQPPALRQPR